MLLTIGMIVKNEEKYLERCLNGIKPILENVDSELIITDTGSTDHTVEIAKEYTNNVLYFEWIKDFSAARNTALKIAQGEWFMFLDADEIFESCDGIIVFFNSGEYQKYNSASYVIRNLYTETEYTDFYPQRLTKRFPKTGFSGAIHEYLSPIIEPTKHINDVAAHYGYLYRTVKQAQSKSERNIELLQKKLREDKDPHPIIYSQLFDSYGSVYDLENAYKYLEKGIEKCKRNKDKFIVILYFQKIDQLFRSGEFVHTCEMCTEYFSEKQRQGLPVLSTDGDIYAFMAESLYELKRFDEAASYYIKYFDTYKDIKSGKLCTEDMHQKTVEMCSDKILPGLFNNFLECCINAGTISTADMYIMSYPLNNSEIKDTALVALCSGMINVLEHNEYKNAAMYVSKLDEKGRSLFIDMLFVRLYITDGEKRIYDALGKIASSDDKYRLKIFSNYFVGDMSRKTLSETIVQITKCSINSIELRKANYGSLFMADLYKCVENVADIGEKLAEMRCDEYSAPERAAMKIAASVRLEKSDDIKGCIYEMKNAINEYKPIAPLVSEYCDRLIKNIETKEQASEMEKLAAAVKNNIRQMIDCGKYEQAKKTLAEYKQINPKDVEIADLDNILQGR